MFSGLKFLYSFISGTESNNWQFITAASRPIVTMNIVYSEARQQYQQDKKVVHKFSFENHFNRSFDNLEPLGRFTSVLWEGLIKIL